MSDIICGFWNGKCQAIMANVPDVADVKKEWVDDGVDEIRVLPREEALKLFEEGMSE